MYYKYQYHTDDERELIINEHLDKYLHEEQNIKEGKFLIFSDEPIGKETVYTNVPEQEFNQLKSRQASTEEAISFLLGL